MCIRDRRYTDESPYADNLAPGDGGMTYSDSKAHLLSPHGPSPGAFYHDDKAAGYFGSRDLDAKSDAGASALNHGDMFRNLETREQLAEKGNEAKMAAIDERPTTASRIRWMSMVWLMTFWVPDFMIRLVGRMPRKDIRTAWREKLAINMLIWLSCAFVVFIMSK